MNTHSEILTSLPDNLSCVLSFDKETQRWVGHCLDFDLATSGKTDSEAWKNLLHIVKMHVEHCSINYCAGFRHKAPPQQWALFKKLAAQQTPHRSDKIAFNLVPFKREEDEQELWIKGVEWNDVESLTTCTV